MIEGAGGADVPKALFLFCVIVDEAAGEDDVPFLSGEVFKLQADIRSRFTLDESAHHMVIHAQ